MTDKRINIISNSSFKKRLVLYVENILNNYLDILLEAHSKIIHCTVLSSIVQQALLVNKSAPTFSAS